MDRAETHTGCDTKSSNEVAAGLMSMTSKHLTEEALLELAGKRLSGNPLRAVEEHLAVCEMCRREYEEFLFAHSVVARMAEIGYQEALDSSAPILGVPPRKQKKDARRGSDFPWGPVIGITVGCICVIAILFFPRYTTTVSAAELLSNAIQHEDRGGDAQAFQVQVSGQTCGSGQASEKIVSFDISVRCGQALKHLNSTPWGHGSPLSAKTYAMWRNSLHRRHDRVTKRDSYWEIKTVTDENPVQTASLELKVSDYHATKLTLDFADHEEISISEEMAAIPSTIMPPTGNLTAKNMPPKTESIDSSGDLLEARAWKMLYQLNADSGWEAVVVRNGQDVMVKVVVSDDDRKQVLKKAFAAYPGIKLEFYSLAAAGDIGNIFPNRIRTAENSPALATEWLRQQFADADARAAFSNLALQYSREILGHAFFLDKLMQRQSALAHCSCEREMATLVVAEKRALGELESQLSTNLEPMFGVPPSSSPRVLDLSEATRLDSSLHELMWRSSGSTGSTFTTTVQQVHDLLLDQARLRPSQSQRTDHAAEKLAAR